MPQGELPTERHHDRTMSCPRRGVCRRVVMIVLFCLLAGLIGGYGYLTDSNRVRAIAQSALSQMIGGRVEIRHATLSIFEGLRLQDVTIQIEPSDRPESLLFSADTLLVKYDLHSLLRGHLETTQIVALDPKVRLCKNLDSDLWNYQHISRPEPASAPSARGGPAAALPEFLLRNARLEFGTVRRGQYRPQGSMAIEGRLAPRPGSRVYEFDLQSRGAGQVVGPSISGTIDPVARQVQAKIYRFEFGEATRTMLPVQVQSWWEAQELSGRIDIPTLHYTLGGNGKPAEFRVVMDLDQVQLSAGTEAWMNPREQERHAATHSALRTMRRCGFDTGEGDQGIESMLLAPAIRLSHVVGRFVFTQDGIGIHDASGAIENNRVTINGHLGGYSYRAPASIHIVADDLNIPRTPAYLGSLPPLARELYQRLRPEGRCRLDTHLTRTGADAPLQVSGRVSVIDGGFTFDRFPVPLTHVTGEVLFGPDSRTGQDRVDIVAVHGQGAAGTPNEHAGVTLNGWVAPLDTNSEVHLLINGTNVTLDPALRQALPPDARRTISRFDAAGHGEEPAVHGNFFCTFLRPFGPANVYITDIDLDIDRAKGTFVDFPYPLEEITGRVQIREDHIRIVDAVAHHGTTKIGIDGVVSWRDRGVVSPELKITARDLPIDNTLLNAIPGDRQAWLASTGLQGVVDLDGRIFSRVENGVPSPDLGYDLSGSLRQGSAWQDNGAPVLSDISAKMRLSDHDLAVTDGTARHGQARLSGEATVTWPDNRLSTAFTAHARGLAIDEQLYRLLPAGARTQWDALRPHGHADVDVDFAAADRWKVALRTSDGSITPSFFPLQLDKVNAAVRLTPKDCTIDRLSGVHGKSTLRASGTIPLSAGPLSCQLHVAGENLPVNDELRHALPPAMSELFDSLRVGGTLWFDARKLAIHSVPAGTTTQPDRTADVLDFEGRAGLTNGSLVAGIPFTKLTGWIDLVGRATNGRLDTLRGKLSVASAHLDNRPITALRGTILKPADIDLVQLGDLQGQMAGGAIAGQVDVLSPPRGPSRYGISLAIRNADLHQLFNESDLQATGQVSASLSLAGELGKSDRRRGRGDVLISGKELYHIPLMLGLFEVTNLSLPITSPFSEGTARYNIENQKITFEQIELRAGPMTMLGDGYLDFGTRKVKMTFVTDNSSWPKLPFVHDLIQGARQELMQIHVSGTVQQLKVSASAMNTFTTTVDEVLKSSNTPVPAKKK